MSDQKPNLDSLFEEAANLESAEELAAFLERSCGNDTSLRHQVEQLLQAHQKMGSFLEKPPMGLDVTMAVEPSLSDREASMKAGLAVAFSVNQAVIVGEQSHSVLKLLGQTLDCVPRIALREPANGGPDPILRLSSPEIPKSNSTSRYQLQGEIARGGMGAILKGRDTDLGRDLAIKVLLDAHKDNPQVIQRFIEEAQIGGQLQHPGIAPVYELGQFADHRPFFSMKLVKGETLSKLLADRKDAADERGKFIGIFEQVCQTMAYAHSRGVIHRDLKPANIMVGAFGEVQVMDWGLAKVLQTGGVADEKNAKQKQQGQSIIKTMRSMGSDVPDSFGSIGSNGSETQMGSVMGTPAYMPPEQALGEIDQMDQRADVFGLGAILAEILTGKPPYVADDGTQVYRMASRGKLDDCFARLDACGADHDLIELTKHCLELEPVDRPKDAGALAKRVTDYQDSVETKLRETELQRASEAARVIEQKKRLRVTVALAAAVVMMMLGGGSFAWWQNQQYQLVLQREARNAEAVSALIQQCIQAITEADTAKAAVALEAAKNRAEEGGAEKYSAKLKLLSADLELLRDLDAVDQFRWTPANSIYPGKTEVAMRTRAALARFGGDLDTTSIDRILIQISESAVNQRIVTALDQLLLTEKTAHVRSILQYLDNDIYRNSVRDAVMADDHTKIAELSNQNDALQQPTNFAIFLSESGAIPAQRRQELLKQAVLKKPDDIGLLMTLGSLFIDDIDERLRWGQAAVSARPESAAAHSFLADALNAKKDVDGAIRCWHKSIELSPDYAIAHTNLGNALREKGDFDGAEAELQIAVELYPTLFATHLNLGAFLCDDKHDFERATDCFRRAIELYPDFPACHSNLGHALRGKRDIDGAIAAYRRSIELSPREAMVHLKLASLLIGDKGDLDDGLFHIRAAIEADPEEKIAHHFLGVVLEESDSESAIACYRKVVEIDPKDAEAHCKLGHALSKQGDLDGAMECYRKGLELNPQDANAHNSAAWTLATTADRASQYSCSQQAVEWARRANDLEPNNGGLLKTLGVALYRTGQRQDANKVIRQSIELGFNRPENWLFLAMSHWQLNEKDKAQEWYDKSLAWKAANDADFAADADLQAFFAEAAKLMTTAQAPESTK